MRPWLAALLLGCGEKADKALPEQTLPESAQETGHTGLSIPIDSDGDGVIDEEDCAPDDPLVFPRAQERCNGLDDDCTGRPDPVLEADSDGDGAMWCEECDDTRADVFPGAEDPDGDDLDSNCDGTDGLAQPLAQPVREGEILWRTAGYALAGGDVDGDGCDDLLVGELGGRALRFFPEVQGGHIDDAPEAWTDTAYGYLPEQLLHRGGDLDGDGRDDAFYSASFADGEREGTGRAYLLPWLGAGEYDVANDATARFDGEFAGEWFGFDTEVADIDGDGSNDLVASAPNNFFANHAPSKVMVFRGPISGGTLTAADAALVFSGEQLGDHAGTSVATGDFDGSGRVDIAIGAPFADRNDIVDVGAVYVLIDPL